MKLYLYLYLLPLNDFQHILHLSLQQYVIFFIILIKPFPEVYAWKYLEPFLVNIK